MRDTIHISGRHLNRQVRRNRLRFPQDFMLQLTVQEVTAMRCHFGTASKRNVRYRPYAFTEHGAVMLASVLNSPVAIAASVQVVRAFNHLRRMAAANREVALKLLAHEDKLGAHDAQIKLLFATIRRFLEPPDDPPLRIGRA